MTSSFLVAPAIMSGIGLFFSVILAVAYRYLRVDEDPRIADAEELLPGSNCGACGQPGCHAFAEQLVAGQVRPSQCTVASPDGIEALAELLNVDPGQQVKRVARLHCAGGKGQAYQIAEYQGFEGCSAAAVVSGGGKGTFQLGQASAGLDQCTAAEFERFQSLNTEYRRKFGFPFIMAVRGSTREQILDAFSRRLQNDYDLEFETALAEVHIQVEDAKNAIERLVGQKKAPSWGEFN